MPDLTASNGNRPDVEPLRFVFIGPSIRSDWHNTAAHTHRAVLKALGERGHQATFLEARRNAAVEGLLAEKGAEALLAFDRDFASIDYRTYDPPMPRELRVWLGREGATADVIVLLDGMDPQIVDAFERTEVLDLVRLIEQSDADGSGLVDLQRGKEIARYSSSSGHIDPSEIANALEQIATI